MKQKNRTHYVSRKYVAISMFDAAKSPNRETATIYAKERAKLFGESLICELTYGELRVIEHVYNRGQSQLLLPTKLRS